MIRTIITVIIQVLMVNILLILMTKNPLNHDLLSVPPVHIRYGVINLYHDYTIVHISDAFDIVSNKI